MSKQRKNRLDLMMRDMDGWEIYQHMRAGEELRYIPVIIVTAKGQIR